MIRVLHFHLYIFTSRPHFHAFTYTFSHVHFHIDDRTKDCDGLWKSREQCNLYQGIID